LMVVIVGDDAALRRNNPTQGGQNLCRDITAILDGTVLQSTKESALPFLMPLNKVTHFIDGLNAVQIALALRTSPGEESMASEKYALRAGIVLDCGFEHQCQFETWPLPRKPNDLSSELAIEFFQLALAVCARSNGNSPVRMEMIDVIVQNERVKRSVDRRGNFIFAECRQRIIPDHLVLELFSAIELF